MVLFMDAGKALGEAGWQMGWLGQDFCSGGIAFKVPMRQPGRGVGTAGGLWPGVQGETWRSRR